MDINTILSEVSEGYFLRQTLCITFLCALGYVFMWAVGSKCGRVYRALLAFPAGLSYFSAGIFAMLVVKIRISIPRLIFVYVFAFAAVVLTAYFYRKKTGSGIAPDLKSFDLKLFVMMLVISFITAAICCAGIFTVGLDNDSYYYFSTYPQILIKEGDLKYEFDVLLTDTGIMAVIINAIPYIFGFITTFGIQHFLNVNFLLIFMAALYEELGEMSDTKADKDKAAGKISTFLKGIFQDKAALISLGAGIFLATSPAYLTTAKWIMAGDYFMVFFFLIMYFGYREVKSGNIQDMPFVLMLFSVVVTMLRQEGAVMAAFLIICLSTLKYTNKRLAFVYLIPVITVSVGYYLRIFVFLGVRPLYAFLTRQKAMLIVGSLVLLLLYVVLIRGRVFIRLQKNFGIVIVLLLSLLNLTMLFVNHNRYLKNLYYMLMNIRLGNGWGYFGYFFFLFLLLAVAAAIVKKDFKLSFFDVVMTGYLLLAVCAAFGRGDSLRMGIGDSGNRVLLTSVPVITYAMVLRLYPH